MKIILLLLICIVAISSCKKDPIINYPEFVLAGDSIHTSYYKLIYNLDNYTVSDSVPSNNIYSGFGSQIKPLNIDDDAIYDIRYGCCYLTYRDFLINKAFVIANNYGNEKNIEFAVQKDEVIGVSGAPNLVKIKLITVFN